MSTTTIFDAIAASNEEKLRALLDGGADANAADDEGTPALHLAVRELHLGCMQALLEAGAGVNARSSESGETAAHLAVYDGFGEGLKRASGIALARGARPTWSASVTARRPARGAARPCPVARPS